MNSKLPNVQSLPMASVVLLDEDFIRMLDQNVEQCWSDYCKNQGLLNDPQWMQSIKSNSLLAQCAESEGGA